LLQSGVRTSESKEIEGVETNALFRLWQSKASLYTEDAAETGGRKALRHGIRCSKLN
jgi:hypothetical protein